MNTPILLICTALLFSLSFGSPSSAVSAGADELPIAVTKRIVRPEDAATFSMTKGMVVVGDSIFLSDAATNTVRKVAIKTGAVSTFAGQSGVSGSADGAGTKATFNKPRSITSDGRSLFVADYGNFTIRAINLKSAAVTTLAGTPGREGWTDGLGAAATFSRVSGITADGGNLYVTDNPGSGSTIRKIEVATGRVTTLAGRPDAFGTVDGIGKDALLYYASGITTDSSNVYFTEMNGHTVRQLALATGEVTSLAGLGETTGSSDGVRFAARFRGPRDIVRIGGDLYVTDTLNHTIRKVVIETGEVSTVAGTAGVPGAVDGLGTGARFAVPMLIGSDGKKLYVFDTSPNPLREVSFRSDIVIDGPVARTQLRIRVQDLLYQEKFSELEKMAQHFRKSKERLPEGLWKLQFFYEGMVEKDSSPEGLRQYRSLVEKWYRAFPTSITARVALAEAILEIGANARGGGYSDTVTEEGWRAFHDSNEQAYKLLEQKPSSDADDCPERYAQLLRIARNQGWDRPHFEAAFHEAVTFEPLYYPFYIQKATYLLPRWNGEEGDWQKFAKEAISLTPESEGKSIYMRIVGSMILVPGISLQDPLLSWTLLKQGYLDVERNFPQSRWNLNVFCKYASWAGDREAAKELFKRIGDDPYLDTWGSAEEFEKWRKWAADDKQAMNQSHR